MSDSNKVIRENKNNLFQSKEKENQIDLKTNWHNLPKVAFLTGISGQDGSYLSEFLLEKGYQVHGLIRRSSSCNTNRINHLLNSSNFFLHYGDLSDASNLLNIIEKVRPREIYNLAAQSHVKISFETAEYTANINALGTLRLLDALRIANLSQYTHFYQASTSELFGKVQEIPQNENTPFYPRSPYGIAKQFAYWICVNYREAYNIHISNGILFNHESPRRESTFVTRKITLGVAQILQGKQTCLFLGNLNAKRDWGHAKDYIEAMWLMLQQDTPDDYVVSTGETHTVREFVEMAFSEVGKVIHWEGKGIDEVGKDETEQIRVRVDPQYFRPTEVDLLIGNCEKIKNKLGWQAKIKFPDLVKEMIISDLKENKKTSL